MTEQEIRDKAPSGSTHYHKTKYGAIYLKKEKSFIFFEKWMDYNSHLCIWTDCYIHRLFDIKPL